MREKRESSPGSDQSQRSAKVAGLDEGMRVLSYLISGVGVYGLLGWLGDHALGTKFLLPIGIVLGAAFGVYVIIRRFGQIPGASILIGRTSTSEADRTMRKQTGGPE
jgi:F0F1-type ATP synthase assembly protein I